MNFIKFKDKKLVTIDDKLILVDNVTKEYVKAEIDNLLANLGGGSGSGSDIKTIEINGEWCHYKWWNSLNAQTIERDGYYFKKENINIDFRKNIRIQIFKNNELVFDYLMTYQCDEGKVFFRSMENHALSPNNYFPACYKIETPYAKIGRIGEFWFLTSEVDWVESDKAILKLMYIEGNELTYSHDTSFYHQEFTITQ